MIDREKKIIDIRYPKLSDLFIRKVFEENLANGVCQISIVYILKYLQRFKIIKFRLFSRHLQQNLANNIIKTYP